MLPALACALAVGIVLRCLCVTVCFNALCLLMSSLMSARRRTEAYAQGLDAGIFQRILLVGPIRATYN